MSIIAIVKATAGSIYLLPRRLIQFVTSYCYCRSFCWFCTYNNWAVSLL